MTRYGMVIDRKRCIGCDACALACKYTNGTPPKIFWSHVDHRESGTYPNATVEYTPMLCMHCQNAPCVAHCPTGASYKCDNGIVRVDYNRCIGCRMCVAACPYGARWYIAKTSEGYWPDKGLTAKERADYAAFIQGTVTKCILCQDKVEAGEDPACVRACPTDARIFGDLDDPESAPSQYLKKYGGSQLAPEYDTDPSVYYV